MRTEEEIILDLCDNLRLLKARSGISKEERDICLSLLISEHIRASLKKGLDAIEIYNSFSRLVPDAEGRERLLLCRELLKIDELISKELSGSFETVDGKETYVLRCTAVSVANIAKQGKIEVDTLPPRE